MSHGSTRSLAPLLNLTPSRLCCLYQASRVMHNGELSLDQVVTAIVALLAAEVKGRAHVSASVAGVFARSSGFAAQRHQLAARIDTPGADGPPGRLALHYGEARESSAAQFAQDHDLLDALATDIASFVAQRRALDELRKRQRRQRAVLRVGRFGFWEWDLASDRLVWSDDVHTLFGITRAQLGTTHAQFLALVAADERALVAERTAAALAAKLDYGLDFHIVTPGGRLRHVNLQGEVTCDEAGVARGMVGTIVDITERKNLERQLLQAQKMDAVGRLAGGVAHDFNNILAVILSFASFAKEELPVEQHEDLDEVIAAGRRAVGLTRQLLAFSRQQMVEPRIVSINAHVLATDKMRRRLLGAHIELATIADEDLWLTKIDPGQLEQILVNLAVNARDAMSVGGKLTIETANITLDESFVAEHAGATAGDHVMLAVSDDGLGMEPAVIEHVFEPFFTTKNAGEGTGLGLATCYGIVKQAGGSIWIYSEIGEGTTVKVYLPRARGAAEERSEPPPQARPGNGELVLVVEDDRAVRLATTRSLVKGGYRVLEAENGEDALRVCAEHGATIDLLLTDIVMPRLSGRELAEQLCATNPGLRVLFMSGYTDRASLRSSRMPSGAYFLQKPFMPTDLARKVHEALHGPVANASRGTLGAPPSEPLFTPKQA